MRWGKPGYNLHRVWSPFPQGRQVGSMNAELNHIQLFIAHPVERVPF